MVRTLLFLLCFSCASVQDQQEILYQAYKTKDLETVNTTLEKEIYQEERNEVLRYLELSSVEMKKGQFEKAIKLLHKANARLEELYTYSVSEFIGSQFLGDERRSFTGKVFERSLIYYKITWAYLNLYNKNKDRVFLQKAVQNILAWDSFYQTLERSKPRVFFVHDYLKNIISILVHEKLGTRNDISTAYILAKNFYTKFEKVVSPLKSFNRNFEKHIESWLKREKLPAVELTQAGIKLKKYLSYKVYSLGKLLNRRIPKYAQSAENKKLLQQRRKKISTVILIEKGVLAPSKSQYASYNLASAVNSIENPQTRALVSAIGAVALFSFAQKNLGVGLYVTPRNNYVYTRTNAPISLMANLGVDLKIPYRAEPTTSTVEDYLVIPISEYAYATTKEYSSVFYEKIGAATGIKYLTALVLAYQTYNYSRKQKNQFASTLAMTQFFLSSKAIAAAQSVDLRQWVGIPETIYFKENWSTTPLESITFDTTTIPSFGTSILPSSILN